jgi:hypothetical protein
MLPSGEIQFNPAMFSRLLGLRAEIVVGARWKLAGHVLTPLGEETIFKVFYARYRRQIVPA